MKKVILWCSTAHRPELHDVPFQEYCLKNGLEVKNINYKLRTFDFKTNLLSFLNWMVRGSRLQVTCSSFVTILRCKNVSLRKKIYYSLQLIEIENQLNKKDLSKVVSLVFRGNNIPLIQEVRRLHPTLRIVIIPHGLYFEPPPENKFYLKATDIITGTSFWPEIEYEGRVHKLGMLENRLLKKRNIERINRISICTTHSGEIEAEKINKTANYLSKYYNVDVRIHPGNRKLTKLVEKQKWVDRSNADKPISEHLAEVDALVFLRGFNNRISNVFYEAIFCEIPCVIVDDCPEEIVNLPRELEIYCVSNEREIGPCLDIYEQTTKRLIAHKYMFQSEQIEDEILRVISAE